MLCVVCGQRKIQLHHHTYDRIGCELFSDVTPLCRFHHAAVHEWLKKSGRIFVEYTIEAIAFLRGVPVTSITTTRHDRNLSRKKKKSPQKAPKPNVSLLQRQKKLSPKKAIQNPIFGKPRIKNGPPIKANHDGATSWKNYLKERCKTKQG